MLSALYNSLSPFSLHFLSTYIYFSPEPIIENWINGLFEEDLPIENS